MNDIAFVGARQRSVAALSHELAHHAGATPYDAIPDAAREVAKLFMLDTLAVSWAGSDAPGCGEAHALLGHEGGRADSTAWVYGGACQRLRRRRS